MTNPLLILALALFWNPSAEARTLHQIIPAFGVAVVTISSVGGQSDLDAVELYQGMNVAENNEGPGGASKVIFSGAHHEFELRCRHTASAQTASCSITLKPGPATRMSARPAEMSYAVSGAEAFELYQRLFAPGPEAPFVFKNTEGTLLIEAQPQQFLLQFKAN